MRAHKRTAENNRENNLNNNNTMTMKADHSSYSGTVSLTHRQWSKNCHVHLMLTGLAMGSCGHWRIHLYKQSADKFQQVLLQAQGALLIYDDDDRFVHQKGWFPVIPSRPDAMLTLLYNYLDDVVKKPTMDDTGQVIEQVGVVIEHQAAIREREWRHLGPVRHYHGSWPAASSLDMERLKAASAICTSVIRLGKRLYMIGDGTVKRFDTPLKSSTEMFQVVTLCMQQVMQEQMEQGLSKNKDCLTTCLGKNDSDPMWNICKMLYYPQEEVLLLGVKWPVKEDTTSDDDNEEEVIKKSKEQAWIEAAVQQQPLGAWEQDLPETGNKPSGNIYIFTLTKTGISDLYAPTKRLDLESGFVSGMLSIVYQGDVQIFKTWELSHFTANLQRLFYGCMSSIPYLVDGWPVSSPDASN